MGACTHNNGMTIVNNDAQLTSKFFASRAKEIIEHGKKTAVDRIMTRKNYELNLFLADLFSKKQLKGRAYAHPQ